MQTDMFDKAIAEIRALQVVDNATGRGLNWSLEFRFLGEDKWHPVKLDVYGIDLKENGNEPDSTATKED